MFTLFTLLLTLSLLLLGTSLLLSCLGLCKRRCSGLISTHCDILVVLLNLWRASISAGLFLAEVHIGFFPAHKHFVLKHLLECLNALLKELAHFMDTECCHVRAGLKSFHCEFFELKHIIELLLQLVESHGVELDAPGNLLLCLFNFQVVPLPQHFEVDWVDVEVVLRKSDPFFRLRVFKAQLFECFSQVVNSIADSLFLLFSQFHAMVFLSP